MPKGTSRFTIYATGGFGNVNKIEADSYTHERRDKLVLVSYRERGQRREQHLREDAQRSSIVILEGWGHIEPDSLMIKVDEKSERSRYGALDPRWRTEFNKKLDDYLATSKAKVIADYRAKKAH